MCGNVFTFAESCTGGLIASYVTSVPGVSGVFPGSIVTYSDTAKAEHIFVSRDTLERFGAVSPHCAAEMARGAREIFGARIGVSVTGIAGPGGGSPGKPVGTVWFAISHRDGKMKLKHVRFDGLSRRDVRARAALVALKMLVSGLEYEAGTELY
jgi:PncC family amidohydrolase